MFSSSTVNTSLALGIAPIDRTQVDFAVNSLNEFGKTRLFEAAERGNLPDVMVLASMKGVDLDKPNPRQWTPCFVAAMNGHVEVAMHLAQHHADIGRVNDLGMNPCHAAALTGSLRMMACLVQCGVDPDACAHDGSTPCLLAASEGHLKIVNYLEANGADVVGALYWAKKREMKLAEILLKEHLGHE